MDIQSCLFGFDGLPWNVSKRPSFVFFRLSRFNGAELARAFKNILKKRKISCLVCVVVSLLAALWISFHSVSTLLSLYVISLQSIDWTAFKVLASSVNSWNCCLCWFQVREFMEFSDSRRFLEFINTIGSVNSWNYRRLLEFVFINEITCRFFIFIDGIFRWFLEHCALLDFDILDGWHFFFSDPPSSLNHKQSVPLHFQDLQALENNLQPICGNGAMVSSQPPTTRWLWHVLQ